MPLSARCSFGWFLRPGCLREGERCRGAPFAGAHSVPSHRFLRSRLRELVSGGPRPSSRGRGGPRPRPPSPSPSFSHRALRKPPADSPQSCLSLATNVPGRRAAGPEPPGPGSDVAAAPRWRPAVVPLMFDIPFTFTYNFLFFLLIRRPCVKTRLCGLFYAQGRGVDLRPFSWTDLTIRYFVPSPVLHRTRPV